VRGRVDENRLGKELGVAEPSGQDKEILEFFIADFAKDFGLDAAKIMSEPFYKYYPKSLRPYGNLYAY
jgi:hypothetical protein